MTEVQAIGEAAHDFGGLRDVMIVLVTAALIVPLVQRLRVSPVLGFLAAGMVLGPKGLGALAAKLPLLALVTVGSEDSLATLGEVGVVLLLFLIGLELSLKRLVTMRRLVFGLGGLQVLLSAAVIAVAAGLLGLDPGTALVIGIALSLSSTAIVVELLSEQQRLATSTGRASFAILLLQDLAVVPLLLLLTLIGPGREGEALSGVALALGQALLAVGLIVAVGAILLRPIFRLVSASGNQEVFVAATLLVAVGSGLISALAGLSMALGAFVAGLLLAETEFRRAIEATIEPFKGLLLGAFFFTVGMSIDIAALINDPLPILATTMALIVGKAVIAAVLAHRFGFSWSTAIATGLLIGACGEFAFIVTTQAELYRVISPERAAFLKNVVAVSMVFLPLLDVIGRRLFAGPADVASPDPALSLLPTEEQAVDAVVIGHGRVGELVSDMLDRHGVRHVVTERIGNLVTDARRAGRPVYFGDARNAAFLTRCGLPKAKAVIMTIHDWPEIDELVAAVRALRPDIVIVARARDAEHARHLYEMGVTDAVPETIEASLQLSEAALVGLGVPTGPVIASIHEKRDEFRATLQKAASAAGRTSHGLRAKAAGRKKGE
ncbi:MAG: cation:proton antiporter domain-containing protein [Hyphomicrobium sp.]